MNDTELTQLIREWRAQRFELRDLLARYVAAAMRAQGFDRDSRRRVQQAIAALEISGNPKQRARSLGASLHTERTR